MRFDNIGRLQVAVPFFASCCVLLLAVPAACEDNPGSPPATLVPKVKVGKVLQLPDDVEIPVDSGAESSESSKQTQQMIRDALDGKDVTAGGALGDVLQAVRNRGSILKGTSLDEENSTESQSGLIQPLDPRAIAAESLLRSARLLHQTLVLGHANAEKSAAEDARMRKILLKRSALIRRLQQEALSMLEEIVLLPETVRR